MMTDKIADSTVLAAQLGTGAVTTDKIASGSVTQNKMAAQIADNIALLGTEGITLPIGTTAQRPTPNAGVTRFNSTIGEIEVGNGTNFRRIPNPQKYLLFLQL